LAGTARRYAARASDTPHRKRRSRRGLL